MTLEANTMIVIDFHDSKEFTAGDRTLLREFLHPEKEPLKIGYSLAHACLKPGRASRKHRLKAASEVYYILEGKGVMHIDSETQKVRKHQAVYIPPNAVQYMENTGKTDLKFLCIVDPAWKKADEDVL
jgi:mannose-6-phosphate isomerase-like protein (cupin superfamily)